MNENEEARSPLRLRLRPDQSEHLRALSKETGTSMPRLVQQAVDLLLRREAKKRRILQAAGVHE